MASSSKDNFRVEAVLPAPAESYFIERDSAAFRSLLSKVLKIGQLEFNDLWRDGDSSFVRMITKPEFGSWVPKSVANQLSSGQLEFHDIIEYNPTHIASPPYKIFVRTESPFLKDKLDVRMTLTIEAIDESSCRQVLEGRIRVRMFGVGRIVEGIVKDSLATTYKKLPEIVRRWQAFRGEALAAGDGRRLLLGRPPVGCEVGWIRREVVSRMKDAAPGDGAATPISALSPLPDASEASDDSPAALVRRRSSRAGGGQLAARQPSVREEEAEEDGEELAEAETAEEELSQARQAPMSGPSLATVYYDADEAGSGAAEDGPSRSASGWQQDAASEASAPEEQPPRQGLAALAVAALARGVRHRRTASDASAASADSPAEGRGGGAASRQQPTLRFWRRFNRDYGEWEHYWNEAGVEQEEEEGQAGRGAPEGVAARAVHAAEQLLTGTYYGAAIFLSLVLMRNGWLQVQPDADADPHDERSREHAGRRHGRSRAASGSSRGSGSAADLAGGGSSGDAAAEEPAAGRGQSLSRVAELVRSRMVSGSLAVAKAPARAMQAAGTSVRQASASGARAWGDLFARPPRSADGGSRRGGAAATGQLQEPVLDAAGSSQPTARRHRTTMSLDTGTAALARLAAATALAAQGGELRQQEGGAPPADVPPPGLSPSKALQRRPSNVAEETAAASARRGEHRVRSRGGRARLSLFAVCRRRPAVKE